MKLNIGLALKKELLVGFLTQLIEDSEALKKIKTGLQSDCSEEELEEWDKRLWISRMVLEMASSDAILTGNTIAHAKNSTPWNSESTKASPEFPLIVSLDGTRSST